MYKSIYKESVSKSIIQSNYKSALVDYQLRQPYLSKEEQEIRELILNEVSIIVKRIDSLIPDNLGRGIKNALFSHTTSDSNYRLIEDSNSLMDGWVYPQEIVKELLCYKRIQDFIKEIEVDPKTPTINPFLQRRFFFQSENILSDNRVIICNIRYEYLSSKKSLNGTQLIKPIPLNELKVLKYNDSKNIVNIIKP